MIDSELDKKIRSVSGKKNAERKCNIQLFKGNQRYSKKSHLKLQKHIFNTSFSILLIG